MGTIKEQNHDSDSDAAYFSGKEEDFNNREEFNSEEEKDFYNRRQKLYEDEDH